MKFGKRTSEEAETIQMAPLIDIVFLTLVFFMTTAVFSAVEREIDIMLPTASSAEQATQRQHGEIFINVTHDGRIILNNREYTVPELQEVLNRVAEHFPGGSVTIRGDRDSRLETVVAVLDSCKNADIQNISIAALGEDGDDRITTGRAAPAP